VQTSASVVQMEDVSCQGKDVTELTTVETILMKSTAVRLRFTMIPADIMFVDRCRPI